MIYLASFRPIGSHERAKLLLTRLVILLAGLDGSTFHEGSNEKLRCSSSVASLVGACCIWGHMAFVASPSSFPPPSVPLFLGMPPSPLLSPSSSLSLNCVFPLYLALRADSTRAVRPSSSTEMRGCGPFSVSNQRIDQEATGSSLDRHFVDFVRNAARFIRRPSMNDATTARCGISCADITRTVEFVLLSRAHARTKL